MAQPTPRTQLLGSRRPPQDGDGANPRRHWLARRLVVPLLAGGCLSGALMAGSPAAAAPAAPAPAAATAESATLQATALVGQVTAGLTRGAGAPLDSASVYAYRLADLSLRRVLTDHQGNFSFGALPAGLYKVIAHKPGFVPAVVLLTRATAHAFQELEFELAPEDSAAAGTAEDFWSIRQKIPSDVLREMTIAQSAITIEERFAQEAAGEQRISTQMQALTGVGGFSAVPQAQLTGGLLDVEGRVGKLELGLEGGYRRLAQGSGAGSAFDGTLGTTSALNLRVQALGDDTFQVTSHLAEMRQESGGPVDLQRYGVAWSGELGPGRSAVSAHYTAESNYYRDPRLSALGALALPFESRTLELRGSYDTRLSSDASLRTGISYRNRASDRVGDPLDPALEVQDRLDLFGISDLRLHPSLVVHVGMLASMLGETYALTPHTGVTVHLGPRWRTEAAVRHRFDATEAQLFGDFIPLYFGEADRCSAAEADCYRLAFARALGEDGEIRVGSVLRQYADTLRVFFSEDFFDQFDSLVFVQGDHVPELNFSLQHRLSPSVIARFAAHLAHGGGGALEVGDSAYVNRVDYLVTSVETHFEHTRTGLELSFHSLGQSFEAIAAEMRPLAPAVDLDRLQLQVTQDLRALVGLGTDWALLLDMQVSRGGDAYHQASEALRHRVVGGLAVRF